MCRHQSSFFVSNTELYFEVWNYKFAFMVPEVLKYVLHSRTSVPRFVRH
jgi:hypothetical protein